MILPFLLSVFLGLSHFAAADAECACSQLKDLYESSVLTPASVEYANEIVNFWDKRTNQHPACIFQPDTAAGVAKAVATFQSCGSQFAVRGGGHMNFPGSNNIDGGVLLTLNKLNDREISSDLESIAVGPGNKWVDVYGTLAEYGRYCIGGRLKTIGVPGLTLIGGMHYFNSKYGFSMDNVWSYDVVLGNGTQVVANKTSNPELFWALKGGANNFGIVTKFVFQTYDIPQISTTVQQFDESVLQDYLKAVCDFTEHDDGSIGAGGVFSLTYNVSTKTLAPSIMGVQEGTQSPPSRFDKFTSIPAKLKHHEVMTPPEWHGKLESPNQMFRIQFAHKTMVPDADQLHQIVKMWVDSLADISDVQGLYPTFVMNSMPKSAARVAKTNGVGNVWGLDVDRSWLIWQFSTGWANQEDDLRITNWSHNLLDYIHNLNTEKGLSSEFIYMGDAGEFQNAFAGMPLENVQRMRKIRDDYDPLGVFTRLNWGGFKLGA